MADRASQRRWPKTILVASPEATIYSCDEDRLKKIAYTETSHYQITKQFLNSPDLYLKKLFSDEL